MGVDEEITLLKSEIKRLGFDTEEGIKAVKFGVLVRDEAVSNAFEALVGTLRAAKKRRNVVS
ncbi:hypothetical protein SISSUDRAFT_1041529 [Sistotremastrum suecicum HHB10207 ss-3]|uniref:Costars domain-containing protein n=1 Tax=Sistotremastrum suecicum HHB10207 ss-3 TaxID=1314776 RepID=A0A166HC33_9AGAM|nr:hypothetical protein SISSUDRAFT_1041529 [Sistotremastrum suecicum HHB10207 ss-3]